MDKSLEKSLTLWLKGQQGACGPYLKLTILLGLFTGVALIFQAYLLAKVLDGVIIHSMSPRAFYLEFSLLFLLVTLRALLAYGREYTGFIAGKWLRMTLRKTVLDKLVLLGPVFIKGKPAGAWANILLEQVEDLHDFYAKYLPAIMLAGFIPLIILASLAPFNWFATLILLFSAPLIPLFMILVGMGAAEANRKNFSALQQLNGHFMDSLKGLRTLVLFHRQQAEITKIAQVSEAVRQRTMSVLRLAFLSSAVLEFFAAISIAILAVYFGFSFLGHINFGSFSLVDVDLVEGAVAPMGLFTGLFILLLAPEFYQPLRELGTHYHAKAKAVAAAQSLVELLDFQCQPHQCQAHQLKTHQLKPHQEPPHHGQAQVVQTSERQAVLESPLGIRAHELSVFSPQGARLLGPMSFNVKSGQHLGVVGPSGAGKTTLINVLLGFLPYEGSLTVSGVELRELPLAHWRKQLAWLGQEPQLFHGSLLQNLRLARPELTQEQAYNLLDKANIGEFVRQHPLGLTLAVGESGQGLSVGQAQRVALARALGQEASWFILDEPTASLDSESEAAVMQALGRETLGKGLLLVTHKLKQLQQMEQILVLNQGVVQESGSYRELMDKKGLFYRLNELGEVG